MKLVRVAGGIVWRETAAGVRMAVVHRPDRDDWTLPKGKLFPGETWHDAARREIAEETGWEVRLGRFAGAKLYLDRPEPKLILYWNARVVRLGAPSSDEEIDRVAWLPPRDALNRLDHGSDRRLLLRSLVVSRRVSGGLTPMVRLAAEEIRRLVIVDSPAAEAALDSLAGVISRVVSAGAARIEASRA